MKRSTGCSSLSLQLWFSHLFDRKSNPKWLAGKGMEKQTSQSLTAQHRTLRVGPRLRDKDMELGGRGKMMKNERQSRRNPSIPTCLSFSLSFCLHSQISCCNLCSPWLKHPSLNTTSTRGHLLVQPLALFPSCQLMLDHRYLSTANAM